LKGFPEITILSLLISLYKVYNVTRKINGGEMNKKRLFSAILLIIVLSACRVSFSENPGGEMASLTLPVKIDENLYGAGTLIHPGKTYYVSCKGNDNSDGLTWDSSWKSMEHAVSFLKPGDTLLIVEGEYNTAGLAVKCSGSEGKPVTIAAAPGHRVLFNSASYPASLVKTEGMKYTCEAACRLQKDPYLPTVQISGIWEEPSFIKLENAGSVERVEELPGTFHYDEENEKLYVRFSNSGGPDVNRLAVVSTPVVMGVSHGRRDIYKEGRGGVELRGSYIRIKGIHFRYGFAGLAVYDGHHNTVENCSFFATELAGLVLWRNTKWTLIKNNYGIRNGLRGGILIDKTAGTHNSDSDNLFTGNRIDTSISTLRTAGVPVYGAIRTYGWPGLRNHFINNIMDDPAIHTFLGRGMPAQSVFQGNVLTGSFSALNWYGSFPEDGSERVIVRSNTVLGTMGTQGFSSAQGKKDENIVKHDIAFINNIVLNNDSASISEAGFADPSYMDYRLQSDSPFFGKGTGDGNRGAYFEQPGNIFYVSTEGNDGASGTSLKNGMRTISAAAGRLNSGDTLYISEGSYSEALKISVSGTSLNPVVIRAYMKKPVKVKEISIDGDNVIVEGLTVEGASGDAVRVTGNGVKLQNCIVSAGKGAGIRAISAENLAVQHCTLVRNKIAVMLEKSSTGASIRDNIFAGNTEGTLQISPDSRENFMASHNAFHLPYEKDFPEGQWGSIKGDLKFADITGRHYGIWADSPAAHAGIYAQPAGALPAVSRPPEIERIRVTAVKDRSVSIAWNTPLADTSGRVYFRSKGRTDWGFINVNEYGTIHSVGLTGLIAGTEYEFKVDTSGRRGGKSESGILSFKTKTEPAVPSTFYVSSDGNDSAEGTSPSTSWRTIRKANIEAGPGDTVLVLKGEYFHAVSPVNSGYEKSRITYRKHGEGDVIINGMGSIAPLISLHGRRYITVDGFSLKEVPDIADGALGISSSSDIEILNCNIGYGNPLRGAFVKGGFVKSCRNLRVEGNVFWGARYHLEIWGESQGLVIKNNTFVNGDVCSVRIHGDRCKTFQ